MQTQGFRTLAAALAFVAAGSARAEEQFFIIAGQSNAVARGGVTGGSTDLQAGSTLPDVKIWKNVSASATFVPMRLGENTVQYPAKPEQFSHFGPEWGMAEENAQIQPNGGARFFKFAKGGTSLLARHQWSPDGPSSNLYGQMLDRLRVIAAEGRRPSCFAWVQGEADRSSDVDAYEIAFRRFLAGVGDALGRSDLKIVWPRLSQQQSPTELDAAATERFRAMQTRIAGDPTLRVRLVNVDDLGKQDQVHFDSEGVLALGRRILRRCFD